MSLPHRLHVVVDPETAALLQRLARERRRTAGDLVGVRDAIHAASASRWRCERIISADRGFDVLAAEGVPRVDPLVFARTLPTT